jgi:hypothetical protein
MLNTIVETALDGIRSSQESETHNVFDWVKAAQLIRDRRPLKAVARLAEDIDWTSVVIYCNGAIVDGGTPFLASSWATPVLVLDDEEIDCFVELIKDDSHYELMWPKEARAILSEAAAIDVDAK